ncbi:glutaredoxin family protein [Rhodococcus ruber]|uniref:glutaredoxin family protein n=1 Tax=Rhodococcus ruber TaxID=1830 RepID=UPI00296FF6A3|nr:glutaredoxin family protein [Rhodococcus ruber]
MPEIVVMSQPGCFPCRGVKRYLDTRGIAYVAKDITEDAGAMDTVKALGYQQTPVVIYGDQHHGGFRPTALDEIIAEVQN